MNMLRKESDRRFDEALQKIVPSSKAVALPVSIVDSSGRKIGDSPQNRSASPLIGSGQFGKDLSAFREAINSSRSTPLEQIKLPAYEIKDPRLLKQRKRFSPSTPAGVAGVRG